MTDTPSTRSDDRRPVAFRPADPLGFVTPEELERLAAVMRAMGLASAKMTADQRFLLLGLDPAEAPAALAALGPQARHRPCSVHACPGSAGCPNGLRDTLGMARRLDTLLGEREFPAKVKVGISGCPRCCAESMVRDVGLIGRKSGWTVTFGGNAGITPHAADTLASGLSDAEALDLIGRVLHVYADTAAKNERTARFVQRIGAGAVRHACGLDIRD